MMNYSFNKLNFGRTEMNAKKKLLIYQSMRLNLLEIGLFAVCMGMMISCNSKEEKVEYPQIIIDNKLESYYERAKWDLYKMNSSGMGRVDYMLYLDSLLNAELNIRDTLTGVNYLNRKLAKNEAEMKKHLAINLMIWVEDGLTKKNYFKWKPNSKIIYQKRKM